MNKGDTIEIEILRINDQGKGIGFNSEGKLIIIEGVSASDDVISIEITNVFEESCFAVKIGSSQQRERDMEKGLVDSPYDLDDGDDEE